MKKNLYFFMSLLCLLVCGAAPTWAEQIKVGFTSAVSGTTIAAPTVTTGDITVAVVRGSQNTGENKECYWGSETKLSIAKAERTLYDSSELTSIQDGAWTGASFEIPSGKTFDITGIQVDLAGQNYKWGYKIEIINGNTDVEKTYSGTIETPKNASKRQVTDNGLSISLSGTAYVKVHYCLSGTSSNSKYFAVPELYLTGTLNEAAPQTQYTKPTISVGAYDQPTGTYAVTLAVQNDEDGTINYTIGGGEQVTGVASGTVVNVPYGKTIVATVSGATYTESDEASATMAGKPKLPNPTYTIGDFDFATQRYSVTLAAADGATLRYSTDGGVTYTDYAAAINVPASTTVNVKAQQANMTSSETTFTTPAVPQDGNHTTPTDGGYTDGMTYNAGAYTIPGSPAYIGGPISSGNSSINGSIKMRFSRAAEPTLFPSSRGFHFVVNPGYTITSVTLKVLNNYTGDKANAHLAGVYVDDATSENLLAENVALPKASANSVAAATVTIDGIAATKRVVFVFEKDADGDDEPNQGQVLLTVKYLVPVYNTSVTPDGYGTMYYEKELVCPAGTEAYTGTLNGDNTVLALSPLAGGVIPANTPAIIKGEGGLFTVGSTAATTVVSSLKGTAVALATKDVTGGTVCVLGYENSTAGFYKYTGETLGANKAYLVVPDGVAAPKIRIVFNDETTAINGVQNNENEMKGETYNLAGQRVSSDFNGIVIKNGKKVLVK